MATGFCAFKLKVIQANAIKHFSTLLVQVSLPALIFSSMQKPFASEDASLAMLLLAIGFLFYAGATTFMLLWAKVVRIKGSKKGPFIFAGTFSNVGFMGFPVTEAILGTASLFFLSVYNIPFQILAFSLGVVLITRGSKEAVHLNIKSFINPNVIAAVLGFVLFLLNIQFPAPILKFLSYTGSLTTPLSMIVIGASLARSNVSKAILDPFAWLLVIIRLIIIPFILYAVLKLFNLSGIALAIPVLVAAMPCAANTTLLAETLGADADFASLLVFISTILSVITIPLASQFLVF